MRIRGWHLIIWVAFLASARICSAQGGPPMITDDPGTPGNHNWEINVGFIQEVRSGETNFQAPDFDFNYGAGDRVQLNFEIPIAVRSTAVTESGLGNSKVGVKWRFLGETQSGLAISTYPHLVFNNPTSAVNRGLADDGWQVFLPIEASQRLGKFQFNGEAGYNIQQKLSNEIWLGLVTGYDATERVELLAEAHTIETHRFAENESVFDFGGRVKRAEGRAASGRGEESARASKAVIAKTQDVKKSSRVRGSHNRGNQMAATDRATIRRSYGIQAPVLSFHL